MSPFDALEFTEVEVPVVEALQVSGESRMDPAAIGSTIGALFGQLMGSVQQHGVTPSGPPRTIYTGHSPDTVKFTVAIPIASPPAQPIGDGPGSVGTLPGGPTMRFTHRGPYAELRKTYGQITDYLKAEGLIETEADWARYMPMWEEYLNDPHTTPEADLLTYIYLPVS